MNEPESDHRDYFMESIYCMHEAIYTLTLYNRNRRGEIRTLFVFESLKGLSLDFGLLCSRALQQTHNAMTRRLYTVGYAVSDQYHHSLQQQQQQRAGEVTPHPQGGQESNVQVTPRNFTG